MMFTLIHTLNQYIYTHFFNKQISLLHEQNGNRQSAPAVRTKSWISEGPSHVPGEVATAAECSHQSTSDLIRAKKIASLEIFKTLDIHATICQTCHDLSVHCSLFLLILLSFQRLQVWTRNQIVCTGCKYSG